MAEGLEPAITLPWLLRLRWLFVAGQLAAWPLARWALGVEMPWWPFAAAGAVLAASNAAVAAAAARRRISPAQLTGGVLLLDTALLPMQLAALGGARDRCARDRRVRAPVRDARRAGRRGPRPPRRRAAAAR